MIETLHLITSSGLQLLVGPDGDEIRDKINAKGDPLDYQFYDDDRKHWATWAIQDAGGEIKPLKFLDPDNYGVTSSELYSWTVTYPIVLAQIIEIITRKPKSLWDKILKPTTLVTAIVLIILVMVIGVVALQG